MLRTRVLSALLLALLLILVILFGSDFSVALFLGIVFLIGAEEWGRLTGIPNGNIRWLYVAGCGALMGGLALAPAPVDAAIVWLSLPVWGVVAYLVSTYRRGRPGRPRWQIQLRAVGLLMLPVAWLAMVGLHHAHPSFLLYLFALVAAADSCAYFAGKAFGKTKLAPELSPGKTREGFYGGLLGALVVTALFVGWMGMPVAMAFSFALLSMLCAAVSVMGDLFESLIKREADAKDSGWIIPGHGGVLDRFDSHIAAAPFFVAGLHWISGLNLYG